MSGMLMVMRGCDIASFHICSLFFLFQAEDGIRDLVRSRGLGDVYKRQLPAGAGAIRRVGTAEDGNALRMDRYRDGVDGPPPCLLYTSDAADERSSVDLGGRRIIKKKTRQESATAELQLQQHMRELSTYATRLINI